MATDQEFEQWEQEEKKAASEYARERSARQARLRERERERKRYLLRFAAMVAAAVALLLILILALRAALGNPLRRTLRVEAGSAMPTARDFLKNEKSKKEVLLVTDLSELTTAHVSETEVVLTVNGRERTSKLVIQDTVAPVAEAAPLSVSAGMEVLPQDLVQNVQDATTLTYEFAEEPDVTTLGTKEAAVVITDEGGNKVRVTTEVSVVNDIEAPVITGVGPLVSLQGDSVDYTANVTVTDNIDRNVELKVDTSQVNLNAPGTYTIVYSAIDHSGNATEERTTLTVDEKGDDYVEQDEIDQLADRILAGIVTDDMTQGEKALAIYNYVRENIWFQDGVHGNSWTASAKRGFVENGGDSYVYAACSRALLSRAGIENLTVNRTDSGDDERSGYRWNLVNCGTGWYHFDAVPRLDGTRFFMCTDAELAEYSDAHEDSHSFDAAAYPTTATEPFVTDESAEETGAGESDE